MLYASLIQAISVRSCTTGHIARMSYVEDEEDDRKSPPTVDDLASCLKQTRQDMVAPVLLWFHHRLIVITKIRDHTFLAAGVFIHANALPVSQ